MSVYGTIYCPCHAFSSKVLAMLFHPCFFIQRGQLRVRTLAIAQVFLCSNQEILPLHSCCSNLETMGLHLHPNSHLLPHYSLNMYWLSMRVLFLCKNWHGAVRRWVKKTWFLPSDYSSPAGERQGLNHMMQCIHPTTDFMIFFFVILDISNN